MASVRQPGRSDMFWPDQFCHAYRPDSTGDQLEASRHGKIGLARTCRCLRNKLAKLRADSGADAARCPIIPTEVTDQKLSLHWESYLPWLQRVLIKQYKHSRDGDSRCFTVLPDRGFSKLHIALYRHACIPVPSGGFVTKPDAWDQIFKLHKVGSQHDKPDTTAAFFPGKSIRTDGVACSVVMHKKAASPRAKKRKRGDDAGPSAVSDIQAHCPSPGDRVVGIDPGKKSDILVGSGVVMPTTSASEEKVLKVSMKEAGESGIQQKSTERETVVTTKPPHRAAE